MTTKDISTPTPLDHTQGNFNRRHSNSGIPAHLEAGRRPGDNYTYVTFFIGSQLLGIPIGSAKEVLNSQNICRVPLADPAISGLLNLRGHIVTAIDLRERLGMPMRSAEAPMMNVIVQDDEELFSLIVDKVGDVLDVRKDNFEPPPDTFNRTWQQCCSGVHSLRRGLLAILSVPHLLQFERINARAS